MCHLFLIALLSFITKASNSRVTHPVDTGRKLIVHKTFRRRPGHLLNVLCMFNLRPASSGSYKEFAPENFGKFTAKSTSWSLFINKVPVALQISQKRNSDTEVSL